MPALLVSQAVGSIPEFPAAYSFSVINGSKFCACCEFRRARAAVPGCEPGIWFVPLALGAKERLKPALFSPATNRQLSAAPPRAHARTLELLSKKFQLRLLTISSQPAVFSPQRKTSQAHLTEFYKAHSESHSAREIAQFLISHKHFFLFEGFGLWRAEIYFGKSLCQLEESTVLKLVFKMMKRLFSFYTIISLNSQFIRRNVQRNAEQNN